MIRKLQLQFLTNNKNWKYLYHFKYSTIDSFGINLVLKIVYVAMISLHYWILHAPAIADQFVTKLKGRRSSQLPFFYFKLKGLHDNLLLQLRAPTDQNPQPHSVYQ